jgi:hypothetical protein
MELDDESRLPIYRPPSGGVTGIIDHVAAQPD